MILRLTRVGIFKPNILPTVLDQYQNQRQYVKTLQSGEEVIVDPEMTINRITSVFYAFINIGALFGIATTYSEKLVGFWLAFLLPGVIYILLPCIFLPTKKYTKITKPNGSELDNCLKIISVALKQNRSVFWKKDFWDSAKPSVLSSRGIQSIGGRAVSWTDETVEDVKRTLQACSLFLWFPLWWPCDGGIGVVSTSQASSLTKRGVPNDLLGNLNPITAILFSPFLSYVLYPFLQRFKIMPSRIVRIAFGFVLASLSTIVGAIIQWKIYETSPCGKFATGCKVENGVSSISVWVQAPIYILGAMSECLVLVTAYEIAYARAPKNMKAIVMAIILFMNAIGYALGLIVSPAIKDPYLVWVWAVPGVILFIASMIFYWRNRDMDKLPMVDSP
jgi:dipeptide/tripeptide permease